jgi:ISXO2-like transposase domain
VREHGWLAGSGSTLALRRVRSTRVGDRGHDLSQDAPAADGVVRRGLAADEQQDRDLGDPPAARDGLGSYQTAWAMLHRYRSVMVRPGRDRLSGDVEVDESFLGGPEPGVPGRGALGKVQFAAAVELEPTRGFGRARLAVIQDACAASLRAFLLDNVQPGARVITDGWPSYPAATRELYEHQPTSVSGSGQPAHEVLPAVHTVFSLVKRWVMGTLQGSVSPEHLQAYFDEWIFRFNRRRSRSRGLLSHRLMNQAANGDAITYRDLRKAGRTRPTPPPPPATRSLPPSLHLGRVGLPSRSADRSYWGIVIIDEEFDRERLT